MKDSRNGRRAVCAVGGLECRALGFRQAQASPFMPLGLGEILGVKRSSMLLSPL